MSEHSTVDTAIAATETVRKARELAWMLSVIFVVVPIVAVAEIYFLRSPTDAVVSVQDILEAAALGVISTAVLVRTVIVALQLGRNLADPSFLMRQAPSRFPQLYLFKRFFGVNTNAA